MTDPRGRDDALGQRWEPKAADVRISAPFGGRVFFGSFLCTRAKKGTKGAGAEPPTISFSSSAKPIQ